MHEWHRRTIEKLKAHFEHDARFLALIVVGSVAREEAREDSDVDFVLVATDEEYSIREASRDLFYAANGFADDPAQQVGGYILDPGYLLDAAERGDERTRFQFVKARIIFSRLLELEGTVTRIAAYPENERIEKMKSFYSQLPLHSSFMELAEYSQNAYLLSETAVALVLFGGRLILAHNRMLYPGRKWFMREFEKAPDKPEGIIDLAAQLLRHPGIAPARAFYESIARYADWPQPEGGTWQRIHEDNVWNWRYSRLSPAER
ncbi:MAG TPA: nucleotidyltransferase domain-containing protein [Anaerolineales bacterium]|nr:nucleotidyltransferase domain-containing protein [Anaerolineales bacterium]